MLLDEGLHEERSGLDVLRAGPQRLRCNRDDAAPVGDLRLPLPVALRQVVVRAACLFDCGVYVGNPVTRRTIVCDRGDERGEVDGGY